MKKLFIAFALALCVACCPESGETIPVIAWHGLSKDAFAKGLPLVKEAGFDVYLHRVDNLDSALVMLDLCQKNGLMAMPQCPELLAEPERVVPLIKDHPALYAYYLKDEPEYWDLEWLGGVVKAIQSIDTKVPCYINLYPNWAWEEEKYVDHINMFADNCPTPMVSFDQYPLTEVDGKIVVRDTWYRNLEEIRTLCLERNRPMWAFSLLESHHLGAPSPVAFYPVPTLGHLRLQVFSDLAYGAQAIQFFTCRGAIDRKCGKGPNFELTQEIISEIKSLSPIFYGCEVRDVWHVGEMPKGTKPFDAASCKKVRAIDVDGMGAVVSEFVNGRSRYLAVVNKDCVNCETLDISFTGRVKMVSKDCSVSRFDGKPVTMDPGDMVIFKLD